MFKYHYFETLDSTNDTAKSFPPFSVIHAGRQTKGRGRMGRVWDSFDGNLFMSLVVPQPAVPSDYSFITSLSVALTLAPLSPRIKWPNDVLINGKKISGILLETAPEQSDKLIIGIGINITACPEQTLYPTTCLKECGVDTNAKVILDKVLQNFEDVLISYQKSGFKEIRRKWLEFATGIGQPIHVQLPNKELTGIFNGLDEKGALLLKTTEKEYPIMAGDVFMI